MKWLALLIPALAFGQFHRAEQDRDIRYWLLDPATHEFRISHDFTVTRLGQKSVHSFVRKGSQVSPDCKMFDLDTGEALRTHIVSGKEVNALGYYPTPTEADSVVVQGDLPAPVGEGGSVRIRVEETYTDPVGYTMNSGELVWTRTLGRPLNYVTLPDGWMLTSVNTPAAITLDQQGRVTLRFTNIRNGDLDITIRARRRTGESPAARTPVLVELFTSEGCSSCPPADALLALLDRTQPVAGADVIVLSEHVDYWNQLGWTDPYSSPAFSRRQQEYGTRFKLDSIYTPEMVIDGQSEFVGNDAEQARKEIQKAAQQEKAQVTLSQPVRTGQQIKVRVEVVSLPAGAKAGAIVYVALAEERALSHVTKGENEGRALQHVAVVRSLSQAGVAKGDGKFSGAVTLTVPASAVNGLRVIAFVQEKNSRHVLGAAQQRL